MSMSCSVLPVVVCIVVSDDIDELFSLKHDCRRKQNGRAT